MIEALLQAERLLLHGMVDDAERIYAGAVEQDPLNAIAMVGLARVALERGDDQLAYRHARHALDVDPENAAALRLEARLAEVFAARGTPAPRTDARASEPAPASAPASAPNSASASASASDVTPGAADARPGGAEARSSEQAIFTRNPSMAEHQQMETLDVPRASPIDARVTPTAAPQVSEQPPERRPGLFRRLLGD